MEFRVLGPLEVREGGRPLPLGGGKEAALLALLLLRAGETLSIDRLIDALWGERPPASAAKSVHVYVSHLRRALGGRLVTRGRGYALELGDDELDLRRFEELVAEGRKLRSEGRPSEAATALSTALSLWRGRPLAGLEHEEFVSAEVERLEELRLEAIEERIDARLEFGEAAALVSELDALVRAHPLRERLRGQLMLALYRSGRQAEALNLYRQGRRELAEELGLEPGRAISDLEQAILRQDRALDSPPPVRSSRRLLPAPKRRRAGAVLVLGGAVLLLAAVAAAVALIRGGSGHILAVPANSVVEIDPKANAVVDEIPVGTRPGPVTAGAGSVWVANLDDQSLSRVDPATKSVVRTIPLQSPASGLTADQKMVWIVAGSSTDSGALTRVDPEFNSVRSTRRIPAATIFPNVSPSATLAFGDLWVVDWDGLVLRLDPETEKTLATVDVGNAPSAIAAGAGAVWVANTFDGTVSRIDPANVVTATIPVGHGPSSIAVGAGAVWVADTLDGDLVRIDPATNAVTATLPVGRSPIGVAADANGVWVVDSAGGALIRVDPTRARIVKRIPLGGSPQGIALVDGRPWVTVAQPPPTPSNATGVLKINLEGDLGSPDPALGHEPVSIQLFYATCAKLLNYPDKPAPAGSQLEPEVAASVPAPEAGGKSYTFRIRPGFRFSPPSNEPVTAETFKYTIERALNPKLHGYAAQFVGDVAGERAFESGKASHISGIVARGDALTIRLTRLAPDFLSRISLPAFCAVPTNTPIDPKGVLAIPAAGPYYMAAYVPHRRIVLKRNPNYHGLRPRRLAAIEYTIGVSQGRTVSQIEAGKADYAGDGVPPAANAGLAARYGQGSAAARKGRQRYFVDPVLGIRFLALNTSRSLFANARLRRAVNYAIDRPALLGQEARYFAGGSYAAGSVNDEYLPPGLPGYPSAHVYPLHGPDFKKAKTLASGARGTAVLYTCNRPPCPQDAQIIATDLKRIGIVVETKMFPVGDFYGRVSTRGEPFDIATIGWSADYPDPSDFLNQLLDGSSIAPKNNVDFSYFNDPSSNRELEAAARLPAPARYRAYATLAVDLAKNAAPWAVIENDTSRDFFSARVGCQIFQPIYGMDLAAICLRRYQPHSKPA